MNSLADFKRNILTFASVYWKYYLRLPGIDVGRKFTCIGRPGINHKLGTRIWIGNEVTLCNTGIANLVAEYGRCRLATVAVGAELIIRDRVGMSSTLICCASRIEIGEGTLIGGGVMILDTDFHPRESDGSLGTDPLSVSKPIHIGKNCFIGARAIILKGVTIGDGATVGASAVVSIDVPSESIVVGNPAIAVKINSKLKQSQL